jgi:N6-adenosine-specific RNA methylase IME4
MSTRRTVTTPHALAAARDVDEVKNLRDKAVAMEVLIEHATDIRLRAERRAGELLSEMGKKGERQKAGQAVGRKSKVDGRGRQPSIPKLETLGITKIQSSRWQKLAAMPSKEFEASVAKKTALASAAVEGNRAVIKEARREVQEEKKKKRAAREVKLADKQKALPLKRYGVVLADPEWDFEVWSESGKDRAAENHYTVSATKDIAARDVASIAAEDCVLFLWVTAPMIGAGLLVMAEWGFTYKSQMVWVKDKVGTGYWFRNQHEMLLVGTRGSIPAPAQGDQWPSVLNAPRGRHSEKPNEVLRMIEEYFPRLPKIELNARRARPNWDCWGFEAPAVENAMLTQDSQQQIRHTTLKETLSALAR